MLAKVAVNTYTYEKDREPLVRHTPACFFYTGSSEGKEVGLFGCGDETSAGGPDDVGGVVHFVGKMIVFQVIAAYAVWVFDLGQALEADAGGGFEEEVLFFVHGLHPGK